MEIASIRLTSRALELSRRIPVWSSFAALGLHALILFAASQVSGPSISLPAPTLFEVTQDVTEVAEARSELEHSAEGSPVSVPGMRRSHSPPAPPLLPSLGDFSNQESLEPEVPLRRAGMRSDLPSSAAHQRAANGNESLGDTEPRNHAALGASGHSTSSPLPRVRLQDSATCADLFPLQAKSQLGVVVVELTVDATGTSRFSKIVEELPLGQGFGSAARLCAQRLKFSTPEPLTNRDVLARPIIRLEFEKSS